MEFHEKLQELRKQKGLTQEELARALYVSRTAVSKWESGRGYPEIGSLKAIAKFFDVTVDALLSGEEMLTFAEADGARRGAHFCDLAFGLSDVCMLLLLCLPFFAFQNAGTAQATLLLASDGIRLYLKVLYLVAIVATGTMGVLTLAMQSCQAVLWLKIKSLVSLGLGVGATLLFILTRQPYAAVFAFALLAIKVSTTLRAR